MSTLPTLTSIGENLRTQDNRITSDPIFLVQRKVRQTGIDPDYCDKVLWLDENWEEVSPEKHAELEEGWKYGLDDPEGFVRTGYIDRWDYVQPFFTEVAAQDFITRNGHRYDLDELRIYVDSAYRNLEWQAVREHLMKVKQEETV